LVFDRGLQFLQRDLLVAVLVGLGEELFQPLWRTRRDLVGRDPAVVVRVEPIEHHIRWGPFRGLSLFSHQRQRQRDDR